MLCQLPKYFSFYSCGNASADPVLPRKGDTTKHVDEAIIVALGLATAEEISSMDKVVPEVTHEATPEAGNNSVESEPQQEHEVDVTVPEAEDTLPDIHASLHNDPTLVSLPVEPEDSLIETELVAGSQVETTSTATTNGIPIDVENVPSDAQRDIEVETRVDDTIKDEPIPESDIVEAADTEGPLEDAFASSEKQPQDTVQLEPEVEPSPTTLAIPASVIDTAAIKTEAITEVGETVDVLAQVTWSFLEKKNIC